MNLKEQMLICQNSDNWICPDLTTYWKLGKVRDSQEFLLSALSGTRSLELCASEAYALRYFTGKFTIGQVQQQCQQKFSDTIPPDFVARLLQKLLDLEILALPDPQPSSTPTNEHSVSGAAFNSPTSDVSSRHLKACVQWIAHPDGYWILRNPTDVTFLQVSDRHKTIVDQLEQLPLTVIKQEQDINPEELRYLLQVLTATGMLEGTTPAKPAKRKFTPMQLLFFKVHLFNPDAWLTRHINSLRWLFSQPVAFLLCGFFAISTVIGFNQRSEILFAAQQLLKAYGGSLLLPFAILSLLVVTLHELGHAFTLKHYGGIVPEVGLMFMFFIPAAYTNTTDSYCLSRPKRVQVVAAGVGVQLIIAAAGLWLWNFSVKGIWLHTTSYLLMAAALFTVAINLNPLSKFDGYYLTVALTGINNLRSRSFGFYSNLFTGKPIQETGRDRWILAAYAPFSLAYIWLVFSFLILQVTDWTFLNIPTTALVLLIIWAIYFYFPKQK
ncbi:hypothetical protein [Coleofasciculus sp. FACHB-129]|uniref:hypothetical protein n=1 Tax=Cyanophyceae TaxID=3028117 RepID=UPI001688ED52|nr:hypothetical protein [Coleofasciculus sp. FACHB-129]MBD1895747.1 hypothetical protein [Coleofasciculus sp. FACHB-129]